jgi:hypothetical protein
MQIPENSRRNFISNIAILSAGIAFKPAISHLPSVNDKTDIKRKWELFWKRSGGQKINNFAELQKDNGLAKTKGHVHKIGDIIYFSKENILAQPSWIYWENNTTVPVDVVITLFEKNSLKKITRLNRFEADALYKVADNYRADNLMEAYCNSVKPSVTKTMALLKSKTSANKNSQEYHVSYYKNNSLVLDKKFIYHA